MGRAAKLVAAMQQRQGPGDRLQIEGPVEGRVATADDQHVTAAELLDPPHGIVHGCALERLDAAERRALGRERAAAGRDHHDLGEEYLALVGDQAEAAVALRRELIDALS